MLHRSSTLTLFDVRCRPGPAPLSDLEVEPTFSVVLPRHGVYVQDVAGKTVVADPTAVVFLAKGTVHRTAHPTEDGDRNTDIALSDAAAEPFIDKTGSFPVLSGRIDTAAYVGHRRMLAAVGNVVATALEIEEWALGLVSDLLAMPLPEVARPLVDDAGAYLAANYHTDFDIEEMARQVGSSPHHLSRVYRRATGRTISGQRTELRLRRAIDLIAQGADDLSRVAVDAGFYDHSHMTRTMRRHAGATPSALRALLR